MSVSLPPITANPETTIEIEDSCNCCFPMKARKKKPKHAPLERQDAINDLADRLTHPVRDANEIYNLKDSSQGYQSQHIRQITTYPKGAKYMHSTSNLHKSDGYDADSTESTLTPELKRKNQIKGSHGNKD